MYDRARFYKSTAAGAMAGGPKDFTVLCMDKSNVDKKIMDSKRLDKSHSRIEILKQAGFMQLLDLN